MVIETTQSSDHRAAVSPSKPAVAVARGLVPAILEARGIVKRFGSVTALGGADLDLREGEVMALVGDNGAGKTTLTKVLAGSLTPDAGTLQVRGEEVHFRRPADALASGIETVYQDLSLVEPLSAVANMFLGREIVRRRGVLRALGFLDGRAMRKRARGVVEELGVRIPSIDAPVQDMSGGQRQSLAIARALLFGREIIILDEPTAALGVRETAHVLDLIRRLRDGGRSIVVVSHNIEQLVSYADRVTVLRLGRTVGVRSISDTTPAEIVSLITGATGPAAEPSEAATGLGGRSEEES